MAVPRKQRRIAPSENPSDSDDNLIEDESDEEMENIEVDFAVSLPTPSDRYGIKNLLQQLFKRAPVNTTELADILVQTHVTGVCKENNNSEDDVDTDEMEFVYGVFSIINMTEKREKESIKQVFSYVLNHCKEVVPEAQYETFKNILEDSSKHIGLIVNERLINMPPKLAVPVFMSLGQEMKTGRERNEAFDFSYYLLICKTASFPGQEDSYLNAEEEVIAELAEFTFEFNADTENGISRNWLDDDDDDGIPKRRVLLIPANQWDTLCSKLVTEFGEGFQRMFIFP